MFEFYVWRVRRQTNRRWYRNICIYTRIAKLAQRKTQTKIQPNTTNTMACAWKCSLTHWTRWIEPINKQRRLLTCNRFRVSISLNSFMFSCTQQHMRLEHGAYIHIALYKIEHAVVCGKPTHSDGWSRAYKFNATIYPPWTESFRVSYLLDLNNAGSSHARRLCFFHVFFCPIAIFRLVMIAWNTMFRIWSRAGEYLCFLRKILLAKLLRTLKKNRNRLINQIFLLPQIMNDNLKPSKCQLFIGLILVKQPYSDGLEKDRI